VTVREARPDDGESIALLNLKSWKQSVRDLIPADALASLDGSVEDRAHFWSEAAADPQRTLLVKEVKGETQGFICAMRSRDGDSANSTAEITALFVSPAHQGQGIGRELLLETLGRLRERGFKKVTLWVLDFNQQARRFYAAAGFTADGSSKSDVFQGVTLREVRYELYL